MTSKMAEWQRVLRWMQSRVPPRDDAMRVDRWLRQQFPHVPQSFLQRQLRQRKIRVVAADGDTISPAKPSAILHNGATVAIDAVLFNAALADEIEGLDERTAPELPADSKAVVERLLDRLVYKDDNFLVLNKPHGLAVQDGTGQKDSLTDYLPAIGAALSSEPPRLVHRLDKETSGLLVLARHRLAAARFSESLRDGAVKKTYHALVKPLPRAPEIPAKGEISSLIDGKPARTVYRRLKLENDNRLWLEMQPVTGRKHQLRIHCAQSLLAPVIGDRKYGPLKDAAREKRLYLHAQKISFPDPFRPRKAIVASCKIESESAETPGTKSRGRFG